MASNKNLTANEEKFVFLMVGGKHTQRKAYREAFQHTKKWKDETVDVKASVLFNSDKVQKRYSKLLDKHKRKAIMTRGDLLEGLKMAFEIATGTRANQVEVEDVLNDNTIIEKKKIKATDLKSITSIAHQIAKLEGWEIDKVEHSGSIKQEIDYSAMDNKQLIEECKSAGMSDEEIVKLLGD